MEIYNYCMQIEIPLKLLRIGQIITYWADYPVLGNVLRSMIWVYMVCHSLFILVNISRYDKWTMLYSQMVRAKKGLYLSINRPNMWSFVVVVDIFKKQICMGR